MINLGLSRIIALAAQLPTKQTWRAVHIAGTNGKGSVAAYLSSLFLRLSKPSDVNTELKIGRFTSPHVIDRWDCITINDQPVPESLFLRVEKEVQSYVPKAIDEIRKGQRSQNSSEDEIVSEFELLTATAFEIFSQQNCQVAIIECGLGGRLDATNALKPQDVACSVITKIGLDHMGILGNTLEAIAQEKAGIVKSDIPVIVDGTNPHGVMDTIAAVAKYRNIVPIISQSREVENVWKTTSIEETKAMPIHQYSNLTLALSAFQVAQSRLPSLKFAEPTHTVLPQILKDVQNSYPARLQHLLIHPLFPNYTKPILLDGAHNPQSAEVLRSYVESLDSRSTRSSHNSKPRIWILAMSQGKDVSLILSSLLERHDQVIFCPFSPMDGMPWVRPTPPATLAAAAQEIVERGSVKQASDVIDALQIATAECIERRTEDDAADRNDVEIVVAGSLYLASDLLRAMRDGPRAVKQRFEIVSHREFLPA